MIRVALRLGVQAITGVKESQKIDGVRKNDGHRFNQATVFLLKAG
jgi:hypothetical protein